MKSYYLLILTVIFFSCAEKKKHTEKTAVVEDSITTAVPVVVEACIDGKLPSVLDTVAYPPVILRKGKDSRTELYLLKNNDSLTVMISGCEKPSYEYSYSTKRYYRSTSEIKFFYGAVNSLYLMMAQQHNAIAYLHEDLINASKMYLMQNKTVILKYPVTFSSQGKVWTYNLDKLEEHGERRTMRWTVKNL